MTNEDEASDLWCPFTRVQNKFNNVVNRYAPDAKAARRDDDDLPAASRCIGERCMAWRWASPDDEGSLLGYCGLAGTPQG